MFVTKNQFYVFISCVAFGSGAGMAFSSFLLIFSFIKNKLIKSLLPIIISLPLSALFVLYGYKLKFPNFRLYMIVGVFCGIYLYFKSFHIILAKYVKKFYNRYKSKRKL